MKYKGGPDAPGGPLVALREACRAAGILFCLHDNYTDIYPDCDGYSYDLTVFNLDGTPQRAWFNAWRHARSYRWAPHAFHPWCIRNAKLLKAGCDPDAIWAKASLPYQMAATNAALEAEKVAELDECVEIAFGLDDWSELPVIDKCPAK